MEEETVSELRKYKACRRNYRRWAQRATLAGTLHSRGKRLAPESIETYICASAGLFIADAGVLSHKRDETSVYIFVHKFCVLRLIPPTMRARCVEANTTQAFFKTHSLT